METSIVIPEVVDARVAPRGALESLSQDEIEQLLSTGQGGLYPLFRQCALAVLNAGSDTDDAREIFDRYRDFDIRILRHAFGVKLEIRNAPAMAFVDGQMIQGTKELLFAVLRDIVYTANEIVDSGRFDLSRPQSITNAVFHILRNARLLDHKSRPNLIVCWGGHSINREEYEYTKRVGYELGLRGLDVCTGCGPGAMKGPMKGATIGHATQRIVAGTYAAAAAITKNIVTTSGSTTTSGSAGCSSLKAARATKHAAARAISGPTASRPAGRESSRTVAPIASFIDLLRTRPRRDSRFFTRPKRVSWYLSDTSLISDSLVHMK